MDRTEKLESILVSLESCLLAFSGGVDSTFLLAAARKALGERCLAVTVKSLFHEGEEVEDACRRAASIGARHAVVELDVGARKEIFANPPDRCYYCKKAIFTALREKAGEEGLQVVIEASHADDLGERRPGIRALEELSVRSPLLEAGFTKRDIREYSRRLGIEGAERPPGPCLATRIPYGTPLTAELLERVSRAEKVLRGLGYTSPRVRDYGDTARLELRPEDMARIADPEVRERIFRPLRRLGYAYVTLDLEGYRSGSMDRVLETIPSGRRDR